MSEKKVYVELAARCHVDGAEKEAGTIVEMLEKTPDGKDYAKFFGRILKNVPAEQKPEKVEE
jgi:hypothetical protein